jgi:hypothetical protein
MVSKYPQKKAILDSFTVFDFGHFWKNKNVHFSKMENKFCKKTRIKHNGVNAKKMKQKMTA